MRVRKAFSMAINRKQITDLLKGGQTPLTGWIPEKLLAWDPSIGLRFDPKKAKQLLDSAGYQDRKTFPKVTISYNTNEDHKRIAEKVQAQLKKYLNIQVELSNEEWKTYLQSLKTGQQQIYRMGWVADYPDPDNFMTLMTSYSENNHTEWGDPLYDSLVEKAGSLEDKKEREKLYKQAQQILTESAVAVIPIYSSRSHWLISDRMATFPLNVMGKVSFKYARFKKQRIPKEKTARKNLLTQMGSPKNIRGTMKNIKCTMRKIPLSVLFTLFIFTCLLTTLCLSFLNYEIPSALWFINGVSILGVFSYYTIKKRILAYTFKRIMGALFHSLYCGDSYFYFIKNFAGWTF